MVEEFAEIPPNIDGSFAQTLFVESIHLVHGSRLVVSSEKEKSGSVFESVKHQQKKGFYGMRTFVNVISQEQITDIAREAAHFKHLYQAI